MGVGDMFVLELRKKDKVGDRRNTAERGEDERGWGKGVQLS